MMELFINNLWTLWLALAIVCLIVEISSGDFYVTCFAIGALCAIVPALLDAPLWLQCVVWAVCSVLSILLIRPSLIRMFHKSSEERTSNADALIGRQGVVTQAIPAGGYGYVKIDGDEWRSVSASSNEISDGSTVHVVSRDSIILTVE